MGLEAKHIGCVVRAVVLEQVVEADSMHFHALLDGRLRDDRDNVLLDIEDATAVCLRSLREDDDWCVLSRALEQRVPAAVLTQFLQTEIDVAVGLALLNPLLRENEAKCAPHSLPARQDAQPDLRRTSRRFYDDNSCEDWAVPRAEKDPVDKASLVTYQHVGRLVLDLEFALLPLLEVVLRVILVVNHFD